MKTLKETEKGNVIVCLRCRVTQPLHHWSLLFLGIGISEEYRMCNLSVYRRKMDVAVHLDTAVHKKPFKLCFFFFSMYACVYTHMVMCVCKCRLKVDNRYLS